MSSPNQIRFSGLDELFAGLEKKKSKMKQIPDIVEKAAKVAEDEIRGYDYAKGYSEGDTGRQLKREMSDGGRKVVIVSEAVNTSGKEYARFVEFGAHGPKQPVFQNAQKKGQQELKKLAKELLKK